MIRLGLGLGFISFLLTVFFIVLGFWFLVFAFSFLVGGAVLLFRKPKPNPMLCPQMCPKHHEQCEEPRVHRGYHHHYRRPDQWDYGEVCNWETLEEGPESPTQRKLNGSS